VRVRNDAYELALKEVEEGREESLCKLVSNAIKFYLTVKELTGHDFIEMIKFYQNAKPKAGHHGKRKGRKGSG